MEWTAPVCLGKLTAVKTIQNAINDSTQIPGRAELVETLRASVRDLERCVFELNQAQPGGKDQDDADIAGAVEMARYTLTDARAILNRCAGGAQ